MPDSDQCAAVNPVAVVGTRIPAGRELTVPDERLLHILRLLAERGGSDDSRRGLTTGWDKNLPVGIPRRATAGVPRIERDESR